MLVIRLARTGRNKYPTYRIVAADSKRAATGKFVMILGHYNPHTKELVIKKEETATYLKNGAQPSNSVIRLFKQEKLDLPEWVQLKTRTRKPKKEAPVEAPAAVAVEASADAAAPEATEAPTEPASEPAETPATETPEVITEVAEAQVEAVAENAEAVNQAETVDTAEAQAEKAEEATAAAAETTDAPAAE